MTLSSEILGRDHIFGLGSMRAVVQGAAAEAPAGAEVRKGPEVGLWSDLFLGHGLFPDPDQHHQSSLPGHDHHHVQRLRDHRRDHHARFCLVAVDLLTNAGGSLKLLHYSGILELCLSGFELFNG